MNGWIYVLSRPQYPLNRVKIGMARDVERRVAELEQHVRCGFGDPDYRLDILAKCHVENVMEVEAKIHSVFYVYRIGDTEWFTYGRRKNCAVQLFVERLAAGEMPSVALRGCSYAADQTAKQREKRARRAERQQAAA